jgi:hypothetical protein
VDRYLDGMDPGSLLADIGLADPDIAGNAGANPVPVRLRQPDLSKPAVQDLLKATFEILDPGAEPWSERHAKQAADPAGATTHSDAPGTRTPADSP